jgi:mRNA interferase RelE/StbE
LAYTITIKESVGKDLTKISKADIGRIFQKIFEELSTNPEKYPELKGKFKGLRKLRIGDYRVIFAIVEDTVLIARIGHRKEIYD